MSESPVYHVPVLLKPCVEGLNLKEGGVYVDVTFGGGGHSREILRCLPQGAHLYSFDQDADAERNIPEGEEKFTFIRSNFRYLRNWMRYHGVEQIDGLLADLGVSSHHFDDETRGFSFRFDAPLNMRMNGRAGMTAAELLNTANEEELTKIFRLYGEMKNAKQIARAIVKARANEPFHRTGAFVECIRPLLGAAREKKDMAKVFQALRIVVNREMEALEEMLQATCDLLAPGGRLVVLTYHSLEDRLVKNYMKAGNAEGHIEQDFYGNRLAPLRPLNNKVVVPEQEEQELNPRSRSAKLRIAEKPLPKNK